MKRLLFSLVAVCCLACPVIGQTLTWTAAISSDQRSLVFTPTGKVLLHMQDAAKGQVLVFKANGDLSLSLCLFTLPVRADDPIPPLPPPVPSELWGVVIEETTERTPQQAIVLASPEVRALFDKGEFRVIDDDTPVGADLRPYLDRAKGKKLPQLYLVDSKGTVCYEGPLPATVAEMKSLVAKYKPGKAGGK